MQQKPVESHSSLITLHELIFILSHICSPLSHHSQPLPHFPFIVQDVSDRDYLFMTSQSEFLDISVKLMWNNNNIQTESRQDRSNYCTKDLHVLSTICWIINWLIIIWSNVNLLKADSQVTHRTILQFLLISVMYPGSLPKSEHNRLQYPFSTLKIYLACFGWSSVRTYCSLQFHLMMPTGCLLFIFSCNIKCFHFSEFVPGSRSSFRDLYIN